MLPITATNTFSNPIQEKRLARYESELTNLCMVQGKYTGAMTKPDTEPEYHIYIVNQVETTAQAELDFNHQSNTPVSGVIVANKEQQQAKEKIKPVAASLVQDEQKSKNLDNQKKECTPNFLKMIVRVCAYIALAAIATAEGYFANDGFRAAGLSVNASAVAAIGIAALVGFGSHIAGGYIQRAESMLEKLKIYCFALIPAFIGFYYLGHLRAFSYNDAAQLKAHLSIFQIMPQYTVSGWGITIISFLMFFAALIISVRFHKTKEESLRDEEYKRTCREIKQLKREMSEKEQFVSATQTEANKKSAEALVRYEYAIAVEKRILGIAKKALTVFVDTNLKYRPDGRVPEFFSTLPELHVLLFFDNVKTSTNENMASNPAA